MERACRENVLFIAVSGDSQPHVTTLAAFVSEMGDGVASLFAQVLLVCDRQGLIGREMFAIDGVKLPSNASKQKSGTRADDQRQLDKMEAATPKMIAQQKHADTAPTDEALVKRESLRLERLHKEAGQLRDWLKTHPEDRNGAKGTVRLSNRTDNGSAKMATSKAALISLAKTLSSELLSKSVRVNVVSPGPVTTPLYGRLGFPAEQLSKVAASIQAQIPLKRFGRPEEIASAVLYLASAESAFIVGTELVADGGMSQL